MDNKKEFLNVAIKAAIRGGRVIYRLWGDLESGDIDQKTNWKDLVTIADKQAEEIVIKTLQEAYPEHQIISEEGGGNDTAESDYQWAIDPLDGTTNFCHNYPFFCTSVGLMYKGRPILGAVYDPTRDELFTAIEGEGAYLNGRPLQISPVTDLKEALLVTGFAYAKDGPFQKASHELFTKYNNHCHGIRRDGAAALDLCYVAAGRLEAFWEYGLKVWDVVAGVVIVREAGGMASDPSDLSHQSLDCFASRLLASNGHLHDELAQDIHNMAASVGTEIVI